MDEWLPDLDIGDVVACARSQHPETDLLRTDGFALGGSTRSPRRNELLQALREASALAHQPLEAIAEFGFDESIPSWKLPEAGTPAPVEITPRTSIAKPFRAETSCLPEMVGTSLPMAELGKLVRLVAPRSTTVLIEGETGTGKELVAKALHRLSSRANKPFAVLNCAAIPEALLEAELFGYAKGAFTGAMQSRIGRIHAAHGGTLFLDEIGDMPLSLQSKILRFVEQGEVQRLGSNDNLRVDVRVVAATNAELPSLVKQKLFREDLYYRLAVFPIRLAPLRERENA